MGRQNTASRALGWVAAAALVAATPMLAGCSWRTWSTSGKSDNGAASSSPSSPAPAGKTARSGAASSRPAGGSSAEAVVAKWVTAIIDGHPKQACRVMAQPATSTSPAQLPSAQICTGPRLRRIMMFRESFTPQHNTGHPVVRVSPVPVKGNTAVVPAKDITIGGQPLDQIMLSHSTGIKSGQLGVNIDATRIGSRWYTTGFDLNVGGSVNVGSGSSGSQTVSGGSPGSQDFGGGSSGSQ